MQRQKCILKFSVSLSIFLSVSDFFNNPTFSFAPYIMNKFMRDRDEIDVKSTTVWWWSMLDWNSNKLWEPHHYTNSLEICTPPQWLLQECTIWIQSMMLIACESIQLCYISLFSQDMKLYTRHINNCLSTYSAWKTFWSNNLQEVQTEVMTAILEVN